MFSNSSYHFMLFFMTVKRKFGSAGSDLLIMAPTTSQPILIERFCGEHFKNVNSLKIQFVEKVGKC